MITLGIIILTVVVSIMAFNDQNLFDKLKFNAYKIVHAGQQFRVLTHGLIHADFMHLAFNMFSLFFFGKMVEYYYGEFFPQRGWFYFLLLYVGGIAFATILSLKKYKDAPWYNSVGASGAVSAVIFASILFDPWNKIYLFGALGIPGVMFGVVYLAYSWYAANNQRDIINHDAHFAGAVFGIVFTIALKPSIVLLFIDALLNPPFLS